MQKHDSPGMLGEPHGEPALTLFATVEGGANGLFVGAAGGANGLTAGPERLRRSSLGLVASDVGEPAPKGSADGWLVAAVVVLKGFVVVLGALLVGDSFNFCSCDVKSKIIIHLCILLLESVQAHVHNMDL